MSDESMNQYGVSFFNQTGFIKQLNISPFTHTQTEKKLQRRSCPHIIIIIYMLPRSRKETLPYSKVYLYKSDIYQILISVTNHSLRKEQWRRTCNPKHLGLSQVLHKVPFLQYNIQLDRVATRAVTRPRWCTAKGKNKNNISMFSLRLLVHVLY